MPLAPITQQPTAWGTSSLPPVDIEVISESPVTIQKLHGQVLISYQMRFSRLKQRIWRFEWNLSTTAF
jgi:hypothetical protein